MRKSYLSGRPAWNESETGTEAYGIGQMCKPFYTSIHQYSPVFYAQYHGVGAVGKAGH